MFSKAGRSRAAKIPLTAEKERKPAPQLSQTFPGITIEDAYAIQSEVTRRKAAAGHRVRGHRVGLTSRAMQQSSQIDEPDYGHRMDYMFIAGNGAAAGIVMGGRPVGPGHVVLAGSFTRPVCAAKGDTLRADFGALGSISVQFV